MLAGVGLAALLALFALRYMVNQVVLGVVLIALASGLTAFLLSQIPSDPRSGSTSTSRRGLEELAIPRLPTSRSSAKRCSTRPCSST